MHKWMLRCFVLGICSCLLSVTAFAAEDDSVRRWAPLIYQTDNYDGLTAQQNVCTTVDYDGDWRLDNNWYNLLFYPPVQAMYYSLVESDTHYYIGYYQYYPRYTGGREHEHDMTGILLALRKLPERQEELELVLSYSNHRWQKWNGKRINVRYGRPIMEVNAANHEIALVGKFRNDLAQTMPVGYRLVPLTELWEKRWEVGPGRIFACWGCFDSHDAVKVTAPWVWEYRHINWLSRPGELMQYFAGEPRTECRYLVNPY